MVPEPVERQLFAGAGAEVFLAWLLLRVCNFIKNVTKSSKCVVLKFIVEFNFFFVATGIYLLDT
jgi:hypothetical protein